MYKFHLEHCSFSPLSIAKNFDRAMLHEVESSDVANSIIGWANIHILMFTNHKNIRFQKELVIPKTKI